MNYSLQINESDLSKGSSDVFEVSVPTFFCPY